jgi:predicted SnoaL-like aldol condensation-catalyzing enzyme
MNKKEIATSFLKDSSAGKVQEAFDKYIHPAFKHHLLFFKGDRESFKKAIEENYNQFPQKTFKTMHVLEDGGLVAIHGKVKLASKVYGVIHIFRFEDDKIIESWEASQEEFIDSPNENGLF